MNVRIVKMDIYLVLSNHMTYSYWSLDGTNGENSHMTKILLAVSLDQSQIIT